MQYKRAVLAGASALALLSFAGVAMADTAAAAPPDTSTMVQEVTVEATRREAVDTMKVPLAVDAYAGKTLKMLDITSESDLSKLDPSLNIQTFGPVEERIIIRGVSSIVGSTTGVYLDETPLQGGFNADIPGDNIPTLGLHDIDHVEVLKGPQGTLFGAGSMDGTLRVVTVQPNLENYSAWVQGEVAGVTHGDTLFDGSGGVNIPIVKDTLAMRINVWGTDGGGYINQVISGHTLFHVNDTEQWGVRGEVLWQPTDNFSLLGTADYQNTQVNGAQYSTPYIGGLVSVTAPFSGPYPQWTNEQPSQEPYYQDFQLYSLTGKYGLGFGQVILNTSYGYKDEFDANDTSPQDCSYGLCEGTGVFPPAVYTAHPSYWYTTDDLRFASSFKGPFQFVAGVYYQHDHTSYDGSVMNVDPATGLAPCYSWNQCSLEGYVKPGPNFAPPIHPTSEVQFANNGRQTTDQVAFYTQADYKILPTLTATAGFRYFVAHVEDELITQQDISPPSLTDTCSYVTGCVTVPYVSTDAHGSQSSPTYNFSLLWQATPDVSFYVRAASGFRLGGINQEATIAGETGTPIPFFYGSDSLWDYEGGVKAYLFDRSLFVDATLFHIDWSNEQEEGIAHGTYSYILNAGKTTTDGLEFDTTWRATPELTFSGGFTYVDAKLGTELPLSVFEAGTPGASGNPMPFVPQWQATGQAEYEHPITDRFTGYGQLDFSYHGGSSSAFETTAQGQAQCVKLDPTCVVPDDYDTAIPAYWLVDLKAGVRWDKYDASIFVRNVGNTYAWVGANPGVGGDFVYTAPPRTIGVQFSAHY
ncbi:MAG TPA: TonB-dependent receptor [Caulobacteraceae bacterium]|jgi:outer membrane receptor protein involved in Fe transport|nr:TonB-dependent receptor [Caulobacteraceae bacterium]